MVSNILTPGKHYTIINTRDGKYNFDKELSERFKDKDMYSYDASQADDYMIIIINDKGHKRKYPQTLFKKVEGIKYKK